MWLWIALGLLGLVALVIAVGYAMPERYRATAGTRVSKPPKEVWDAVVDCEKLTHGGRMCRRVRRLPGDGAGPCWEEDLGQTVVTIRTERIEPPRRIVRTAADSVVPMTARFEIELEPDGAGTSVTLVQETRIERGTWHVPIFRLTMALGARKAGPRDYLTRLVRGFGEDAPVDVT